MSRIPYPRTWDWDFVVSLRIYSLIVIAIGYFTSPCGEMGPGVGLGYEYTCNDRKAS